LPAWLPPSTVPTTARAIQRAGQCGYPRRGDTFDRPDVGSERKQYHLFRLGRAFFRQQRRGRSRGDGGSALTGGGDAAKVAAGTLVSITGANLSAGSASADPLRRSCPTTWRAPRCNFNGICSAAVLGFAHPDHGPGPWEVNDTTSVNAFVRSVQSDGRVVVTTPVAVTIVPQNPGIYSQSGTPDPVLPSATVGLVYHGFNEAVGVVSVDGTAIAGDTATAPSRNAPTPTRLRARHLGQYPGRP